MAVMTALAVGGALVGAGMGVASAVKATEDQKEAERKQREQEAMIKSLEDSRQEVINPMAGLTNEAEKIGVATQAAKFQAEEADQALANTLDTIMATGGGAGGATALAQMALKSKQGISADLQKQERANAVNVANSQQVINQQIAEGEKFAWQYQEQRERTGLNRAQNLADKFEAQAYAAEAAKWEAYGNIASSVVTGMGNVAGAISTQNYQNQYDQYLAAFNDGNTGISPPQSVGKGSVSQTSDRRLKKNINYIGDSDSGIKIYTFEYIDKEGTYKGVMSDEIPSNAVIKGTDGYDRVDYSKIDVEFEKIK